MDGTQYLDMVSFLHGERLKENGSNFISWYLRLRAVLKRANLSFLTKEHVGNPPANNMDAQAAIDHHYHRRTYAIAKGIIETIIPQSLREEYADLDTYDMIDEMKSSNLHRFRVARFELESEFLSTKMEEGSCLKAHLAKMHEIHLSLVDDFDYETTHESAIYTVLHSLPPSYTDHVHGYVGRGESLEFSDFMDRLPYLEVEPIEGEVVDGEGIYLIYFINVYSLYTTLVVNEYMILILFYKNRTCRCMDGKR